MRKIIITGAILFSFCLMLPNTAASLVFDRDYETEIEEIYIPTYGDGADMDVFDLETINNLNNTIFPLQNEDERFRGIVQCNPTFPTVATLSKDAPVANWYTMTIGWKFVPDKRIVFDTLSDIWLRLPVNNITIGTGPGEVASIRLSTYKIYSEDYNVSLTSTLGSSTITAGPHGDTAHTHIFTTENLLDSDYSNFVHQDNRTPSWKSYYQGIEKDNNISYNFTYVRLNQPLLKDTIYIFILEILVYENGVSNEPLEILFTNGDNNNDGILRSHFYFNNTRYFIPLDVDAPVIVREQLSSPGHGIGFFNTTEEITAVCYTAIETTTVTTNHFLSVIIPVFSLKNISLDVSVRWTPGPQTGATDTINLKPGYNTIFYETQSVNAGSMTWFEITLTCAGENASSIAILSNSIEGGYAGTLGTDTAITTASGEVLHHSPFILANSFQISTTQIQYIPLDQYEIYVVPNPADYEASQLYIADARLYKHALENYMAVGHGDTNGIMDFSNPLNIAIWTTEVILEGMFWTANFIIEGTFWAVLTVADLIYDAMIGLGRWVVEGIAGLLGIPEEDAFGFLRDVGLFISQVIEFLVHALSWLVSNAVHLLALWVIMSTYLLGTYAANGICSAVTRGRAKKKRGQIINISVFEREIRDTYRQYMRLTTLTMSIIAAVMSMLLGVLNLVLPF